MATHKANEEGKIGGFDLIPTGKCTMEITDIVIGENQETKEADPKKLVFKLESGEHIKFEYFDADISKSLASLMTILHHSGMAKKMAEKNAGLYGTNILEPGWDDSVFLEKEKVKEDGKEIEKAKGFSPKFITHLKIVSKGAKFNTIIEHKQGKKNKEKTYAVLGKVWAYSPNETKAPVGVNTGAGAKAEDEDF